MAQPKITPSGRWQIQVYIGKDDKGKRIYKAFTGDTAKQAQQLADEYLKRPREEVISLNNMTVGDAVDAYIKRREDKLSPKTIREYKAYRRTALQGLMNVPLLEINDSIIQAEIDKASVNHSGKSVHLWWGLVGSAIKKFRKGYIPDIELPAVKHKKIELPDNNDLMRLFVSVEGDPIEIPVLLAAACGLRRGEIAALDLNSDIDYSRGLIFVTKAYTKSETGEWILKPPKTEAGTRTVVCPAWIIEKLKFARESGYTMYKPGSITNAFKRWAGQNDIKCTFHGLRHYFASVMLMLNVPDKYAMERMGHSTNYMLKRYQEIMNKKEIEINDAMQNYFDGMNPNAK